MIDLLQGNHIQVAIVLIYLPSYIHIIISYIWYLEGTHLKVILEVDVGKVEVSG